MKEFWKSLLLDKPVLIAPPSIFGKPETRADLWAKSPTYALKDPIFLPDCPVFRSRSPPHLVKIIPLI